MSRIFELSKVMFKNSGFATIFSDSKKEGKHAVLKKVLLALFLIICVLTVSVFIGFSAYGLLIIGSSSSGYDHVYLKNILLIYSPMFLVVLITLLSTLFISSFFFSQDNPVYMPLPIKSHELFIARLLNTLILAYALQFFLLLPCVISFNIILNPNVLICLNEIMLFIFLPFIPLSIVLVFNSLLAKVINIAKCKTLFSIISFMVTMTMVIIMNLIAAHSLDFSSASDSASFIKEIKDSIALTASKLEFLNFYSFFHHKALTDSTYIGLLMTLLYGTISFIILFLSIVGISPTYMKTLIKSTENIGGRKKKVKPEGFDKYLVKNTKPKSRLGTLVSKEFRDLFRSNNNIIQLVIPPFFFIILMAIGIFATIGVQKGTYENLENIINHMSSLITFDSGWLIFYVIAASFLVSLLTLTSATSFSRDGPNAFIYKMSPVSPLKVIVAKILPGFIIDVGILLITILGLGIGLKINWAIILLCIVCSIIANFISHLMVLMIDIKRPFLTWVNEIDAIKQNMNCVFSMLALLSFAIIFAGLGTIVFYFIDLDIILASCFISGICLFVLSIILIYINNKGFRIYDNIK